jgi:cytidylate kinase
MPPSTIAIDGPVASGKSTIGKRLADRLGYLFFDTGVMYRAVTFLALRELGTAQDAAAVTTLARLAHIDVQPSTLGDGRDSTILAGLGDPPGAQADLTWAVRGKVVENNVSLVAAIPEVRHILTAQMRRVGLRGRVVMVGRDVGTVILPEAELKVFLNASVETRARRRYEEVAARGETRDYDEILANLRERDRIDSSRSVAPLRKADDAIEIDTSDMTLDEVIEAIEELVGRGDG